MCDIYIYIDTYIAYAYIFFLSAKVIYYLNKYVKIYLHQIYFLKNTLLQW
jgi:hypothetical protein